MAGHWYKVRKVMALEWNLEQLHTYLQEGLTLCHSLMHIVFCLKRLALIY